MIKLEDDIPAFLPHVRSSFTMCLSTVQEKTQQGYEATMEFVVGKHLCHEAVMGMLNDVDFMRFSPSKMVVL